MSALGRLVAAVALDTAEFSAGADRAKYQAAAMATSVDKTLRDLERSATGTVRNIAGAFAAGFGIAALKNAFDGLVQMRAELDKMSTTTGASVQNLSVLSQAAKMAGTSLDTVQAAMVKMTKGMSSANADTKDTAAAFS